MDFFNQKRYDVNHKGDHPHLREDMVSYYLRREIRERMEIARDLATSDDRDWETIGNISAGLEVVFAVTAHNAETDQPEFVYVSNSSWELTGYWPNELVGENPTILQNQNTNIEDARAFMSELVETGRAEVKLVNRRKNGEQYGCHILGCKAPQSCQSNRTEYFAFFAECALAECTAGIAASSTSAAGDSQGLPC